MVKSKAKGKQGRAKILLQRSKRFVYALCCLTLLACSHSYIANELEHYDVLASEQGVVLQQRIALETDHLKIQAQLGQAIERRYCFSVDHCVFYQDYAFQPLGQKQAPVLFLFPGYGMNSWLTLLAVGTWFHSLGFHVVSLPGPTEISPFDFGRSSAKLALALIDDEFSDRALYAYSYSMGSVALTELQRHLKTRGKSLQAAIVTAPLLSFQEGALTTFLQQRQSNLQLRLIRRKVFEQGVQRVLQNAQVSDQELNFRYRSQWLPPQSLLIASATDTLSPYQELMKLSLTQFTWLYVEQAKHIELSWLTPELRGEVKAWLAMYGHLQQWPRMMQAGQKENEPPLTAQKN